MKKLFYIFILLFPMLAFAQEDELPLVVSQKLFFRDSTFITETHKTHNTNDVICFSPPSIQADGEVLFLLFFAGNNSTVAVFDLYKGSIKADGGIEEVELISNTIIKTQVYATGRYHYSPIFYTYDKHKIYQIRLTPDGKASNHDVYVSKREEGMTNKAIWGKSERLPEPLNSYHDEWLYLEVANSPLYILATTVNKTNVKIKIGTFENGKYSKPIDFPLIKETLMAYPFHTFTLAADGKTICWFAPSLLKEPNALFYYSTYEVESKTWSKPKIYKSRIKDFTNVSYTRDTIYCFFERFIQVKNAALLTLKVEDSTENKALAHQILQQTNGKINFEAKNKQTEISTIKLYLNQKYHTLVTAEGYLPHSTIYIAENEKLDTLNIRLQKIEPNKKYTFKTIYFETNSSQLPDEAEAELDWLFKELKNRPEIKISLQGYADKRGSAAANEKLSAERARSVANYLITKGIDATRIQIQALGSAQASDKILDTDRKVEFILIF
ncbi:OmpA family protein [Hugenholtzia roseola]|uniref:OmpA family protein n=1 Tax=Hugenholtzia roseola TaxID=1002 RepID=UPI000404C9D4|nr:OmpA family protein [Hugenholtzia roseola]